jgi:hypothetical protein
VGNPTEAALFRSIDQEGMVVLIDEFEKAKEETQKAMLGVLNAGFTNGTVVRRVNKDTMKVELVQPLLGSGRGTGAIAVAKCGSRQQRAGSPGFEEA